jgi:hypothetical protein
MSEQNTVDPQAVAQIKMDLQELARLLRAAGHLEPAAQQTLASLLEELGGELEVSGLPSAPTAHLAETVGRVARALHEQQHSGLLAATRDRLHEAACRAEAEAPVATGIVRRFIDALAGIGI